MAGYSPRDCKELDTTEQLKFDSVLTSPSAPLHTGIFVGQTQFI